MKLKLYVGLIGIFLVLSAEFGSIESGKHGRKHRGRKRHNKRHDRRRENRRRNPNEVIKSSSHGIKDTSHIKVHPILKKTPRFGAEVDEWRVAQIRAKSPSKRQILHEARAKVGHHSKTENIEGKLIHILDRNKKSHFGCSGAIANTGEIPIDRPWVALVERGKCYFFIKIRLAYLHNASGVIIYNNKEESHVMNTAGTNILSVMVQKSDGERFAKLAESEDGVDIKLIIFKQTHKASKKKTPKENQEISDSSLSAPTSPTTDLNSFLFTRKHSQLVPGTTVDFVSKPSSGNSLHCFFTHHSVLVFFLSLLSVILHLK